MLLLMKLNSESCVNLGLLPDFIFLLKKIKWGCVIFSIFGLEKQINETKRHKNCHLLTTQLALCDNNRVKSGISFLKKCYKIYHGRKSISKTGRTKNNF